MANLLRRIADFFGSKPSPPLLTDAEREPTERTLPMQTASGIVPPVEPPAVPGADESEH